MNHPAPVSRREPEYRHKVAELARLVLSDSLDYFEFLTEVGGHPDAYQTGDDEVNELIDLLEHWPAFGEDRVHELLHALAPEDGTLSPPTMTVNMPLLDEGVDCWRPVQAVPAGKHTYRIVSVNTHPDDESWQFATGQLVECRLRPLSDGDALVAVALA